MNAVVKWQVRSHTVSVIGFTIFSFGFAIVACILLAGLVSDEREQLDDEDVKPDNYDDDLLARAS